MKTIFKTLGVLLLLFFLIIGGYYFINNEKLPTGNQGKKADDLAVKMLTALNNEAFKNTEVIEWSFRGKHFYKWYKKEHIVIVYWKKNKVILHTKQPDKSEVFVDGLQTANEEIRIQARDYFNNDSFW